MLRFSGRKFEHFSDYGSAAVFRDIEFRNCYFQGSSLSITLDPAVRSTVRNVQLIACSQRGCSLGCAVVEDVVIDGFVTNGQLFQSWGAVFGRVVLQGKLDRLMISNEILGTTLGNEEQRQREIAPMRIANAEYYRHVEWALDISRGEFKELDIRGVPADLIRRDPDTQVVVSRAVAEKGEWRSLEFQEGLFPLSIEHSLQHGESAVVLLAPKRHRKFRRYLEDIKLLRKAGIAQPD